MKNRFRPIDSLIVLFLGCTLALLFLLIASAIAGSSFDLPPVVTKAYSSVWAYVTGAGASIFLAVFRAKTDKDSNDDSRAPNYLFWSIGTSVLLLALTFATAFAMHKLPGSETANLVTLRLWLDKKAFQVTNLSILEKHPLFRQARTIAPNDGHYDELFDWPQKKGDVLEIFATPVVTESQEVSGPNKELKFCFVRNPKAPTNKPPFEVYVECSAPDHCDFSPTDFGWAEKCPADTPHKSNTLLDLVREPVVLAQTALHPSSAGWRVPSLATLSQLQSQKPVAYTAFNVKSGPAKELSGASMFRYEIVANGTPLYVDGWSPENMLKEFDPQKGMDFSFAVENLDFSGAENGCENIDLHLAFLNGDQTVKELTLHRKYAALRDASSKSFNEGSLQFVWTGKYMKPKVEDRAEVFVNSTTDLQEAALLKKRIDSDGESFEGLPVIAVLRPPLNSPEYGVVIGVRQPTGQVRFTFDPAVAARIKAWVHALHVSKPKRYRSEPNLYMMRAGDSGTGKYQACAD